VLYVAECIGLIVIWIGDRVCSKQDVTARPVTVRPLPEIAES
jgi:hypothetical protein